MERGQGKRRTIEEVQRGDNQRSSRQLFEDDIDKLELIRKRFAVSFREAKEALSAAGGDLVEALAFLEDRATEMVSETVTQMNNQRDQEMNQQINRPTAETARGPKRFSAQFKSNTRRPKDQAKAPDGDFMHRATDMAEEYLDEAVDRTADYLNEQGAEASHQAKHMWHFVQDSAIAVRRGDEVVARIPAAVGLVGLAGTVLSSRLAFVGALGLASALGSGYSFEMQQLPERQHEHFPEQ